MKFLVHTYGCQMNVRDSEAVEAMLLAAGHTKASGEDDAELVIVNSCTVRQKAEEKAVGKTGNLCAAGKLTGLMGCAVKRLGEDVFKRLPKLDFAVGPRAIGLIPKIIADGRYPRLELGDDMMSQALASHVEGGVQAFVTVLVGCDNRCSYCIVPDVRGHEYSRPAREVVAEVRALVENGVKEVCLLGQSVLRYGVRNPAWFDSDPPSAGGYREAFPRLLEALAAIPGLKRIRFTSAHPKGCTDELMRAYREFPQVCRHLHLPVQSGSDRILEDMGRHYTRAEYLAAVAKLRGFDPEFALTTDVIVGYPGETEADFEATRSLMQEAGFDNSFVFKYSPRPGTRSAAKPDDVPKAEKERRDQVLLADQEARGLARNSRLVGTVREVMVEGPSKRNKARFSGRDSGNRIVVWDVSPDSPPLRTGEMVKLRIIDAHAQILIAENLV
ncbi:MAG: tRNA (N6-isopentenyl adenosine(37)-C2)-methylthiotransferase MiaB [Kiritimatiellae bacterium]|nr:tRNA (N6-isopentenyl adenosine(37)-C2)-methylthiotransferase MiaB [Kiritimatiellia bacterium]MBR4476878.1 tRNA (N6-isopentenyl adenosine(37)-C2)-methylthiotransferase MiaB [Kiritimatiellia bacterium]